MTRTDDRVSDRVTPPPSPRVDPLGRAMYDFHRGEYGHLRFRDGAATRDGHVREFYFTPPSAWAETTVELLERVADHGGPVLDVGCGSGKHPLWFQDRNVEILGIDVSPLAVRTSLERGVERAAVGDMFDLPFPAGAFRSLNCIGTQIGLAGSFAGVRALLAEFSRVTDDHGLAVVDNYDPRRSGSDVFGYRPDPRGGVAHRCFSFEYDPANGQEPAESHDQSSRDDSRRADASPSGSDSSPGNETIHGRTLHFLLFSPDRLRDATIGTGWRVVDVLEQGPTYRAVLEK